jgi:hypothetical protein
MPLEPSPVGECLEIDSKSQLASDIKINKNETVVVKMFAGIYINPTP